MMTALLFVTALGASEAMQQAFENANTAYQAEQFQDAARQYQEIVNAGVADPVVFYNLGNARFRMGELGPAVANYERALQLAPRMRGARDNLRYAIAATSNRLARPLRDSWREALLFWDDSLTLTETRWGGIVLWVAFWAVLLARYLRRDKRLTYAAVLLFLAAAALITSTYAKQFPMQLAVASGDSVAVRTGTSDDDTLRFELKPGDRVRVQDTRPGWLQVSTVNGDRGWAREEGLILVGPPYTAPRAPETP
ncbi:MAG: hypothetical protein GC168_11850 [Candidatus Hydrogenedens sp.]|nr:hypothetical protein [Candidatus Hydrogenedens sp.]